MPNTESSRLQPLAASTRHWLAKQGGSDAPKTTRQYAPLAEPVVSTMIRERAPTHRSAANSPWGDSRMHRSERE